MKKIKEISFPLDATNQENIVKKLNEIIMVLNQLIDKASGCKCDAFAMPHKGNSVCQLYDVMNKGVRKPRKKRKE